MSSEMHPRAVTLARILLIVVGIFLLAVGAGMYFSGATAATWVWALTIGLGAFSLISAYFDSSSGVVATVIIFFYPMS